MVKTITTSNTPLAAPAESGWSTGNQPASTPRSTERSPGAAFMTAVLGMSWQLAIVVLVPIIGGFKLDQHLHTLPLLTAVGFVLAMIGMGIVVWRQLQRFSPVVTAADIETARKLREAEEKDGDDA